MVYLLTNDPYLKSLNPAVGKMLQEKKKKKHKFLLDTTSTSSIVGITFDYSSLVVELLVKCCRKKEKRHKFLPIMVCSGFMVGITIDK